MPSSETVKAGKLTKAQRDMLERAVRDPSGNPLRTYGIRQLAGGAKRRMFDAMKARGWFDEANGITPAGRAVLTNPEARDD